MKTIAAFLKETGLYKAQRDAEIRRRISVGVKRNWIKRRQKYPSSITINTNKNINEDKPDMAGEHK